MVAEVLVAEVAVAAGDRGPTAELLCQSSGPTALIKAHRQYF